MLKTQALTSPFSPPVSLPHTHTPTNTTTPQNLTSPPMTPSLCFAAGVLLQLLTDFLVFLQSRKASEQAKSVDSKTDSIGSGRAIPIKQVSSFPHSLPYISHTYLGKYDPFCICFFLFNVDTLCVQDLHST